MAIMQLLVTFICRRMHERDSAHKILNVIMSELNILIGWLNNVNCQHFSAAYLQSHAEKFQHGIAPCPWEKQQCVSPMRVQRALSPVPFILKDRDIVGVD